MEQTPVEVEAVGLVPAEGVERVGKATTDRSRGVDADQVQVTCPLLDLRQYLSDLRQGLILHAVAVPGAVIEL
ncbi:hypothetical protein D3C79_716160 [compost metagenome]